METMLTIRESLGERCGRTDCVRRKQPRPLRLTSLSQSANVCSSNGLLMAREALLTIMSMERLKWETVLSIRCLGPSTVEMSASMAMPGVVREERTASASWRRDAKG